MQHLATPAPRRWSDALDLVEPGARHAYFALALYVPLLAVAVWRHEPWSDEAQAWLLAKDSGIVELFIERLRYEGSPGLWHLILMVPAKLGLPYFTINIISFLFAVTGVWFFLRRAPLPLFVKMLFPFTFFVLFQYAVVARSYCLMPLLLFLIADNYDRKIERPYRFALLLILLANVSTHGLLIAVALAAAGALDVLRSWKRLDLRARRSQIIAACLFACVVGLLALALAPPADLGTGRINNLDPLHFVKVNLLMLTRSLMTDDLAGRSVLQMAASLVVFAVTLWWLWLKGKLLPYVLPLFALFTLFAVKYHNVWHEGILFLLWIFALWISFGGHGGRETPPIARKLVTAAATAVLAVHVYWAVHALRYDIGHVYSGSLAVAEYIKAGNLEHTKIHMAGFKAIAVLPYFDRNIFANHNPGADARFWVWSTHNAALRDAATADLAGLADGSPEVIVLAFGGTELARGVEIEGYELVNAFDGALCWKTGLFERDSYLVFRKKI